jgi:hypothetical protein
MATLRAVTRSEFDQRENNRSLHPEDAVLGVENVSLQRSKEHEVRLARSDGSEAANVARRRSV